MTEAALIAYFLFSTALTLPLGIIALGLGRRRAALRHRLLTLGLGVVVLLPLATAIGPASLRWEIPMHLSVAPPLAPRPAPPAEPASPEPGRAVHRRASDTAARLARATSPTESPAAGVGAPARGGALLLVLSAVGLGILMVTVHHLTGSFALRRLEQRASSAPRLARHAARLGHRMGLRRGPSVLISSEVGVPITWGLWKPRIALPAKAREWPAERLDVVLLHELAHVRRRDALGLATAKVASALYWWNPLVWWLASLARGDAEVASDSLVLDCGVGPTRYARELLAVLRSARPDARTAAAVALGCGIPLSDRIARALAEHRAPGLLPRWATLVAAGATLLVGAGLATAQPAPRPAERSESPSRAATSAPVRPLSSASASTRSGDTEALLEAVRGRLADRDPMVRRSALNALRDLEGPAAETDAAITPLLDDPDPEVRRVAEVVLGLREPKANLDYHPEPEHRRAPEPGELARLEQQLRWAGAKERENALYSLGELRDPELPRLFALALNDESKIVRQVAAGELGDLGAADGVPFLERALRDPSEHVRQAAAGSLGAIGPPAAAALPALLTAAGDPDEHVRQAAIDAIGDIGSPSGEPTLLEALDDPNPFVRQSALNSLVELHAVDEGPR